MRSKYLKELGVKDYVETVKMDWAKQNQDRLDAYFEEKLEDDITSLDTWSFDETTIEFVYCGLKKYVETAGTMIDLENSLIELNGKKVSRLEYINTILEPLEKHIKGGFVPWNQIKRALILFVNELERFWW